MRDDAGKPVLVLNPHGFADWPLVGDARITRVRSRVALAMSPKSTWSRGLLRLVSFVLFVAAFMIFGWLLRGVLRLSLPGWGVAILGAVCAVSLQRALVWFSSRSRSGAIADVMLEDGLCASCGFNLHGVDPDERGLLVCPECGAAWSSRRVLRALPFAQDCTMGAVHADLVKNAPFQRPPAHGTRGEPVNVNMSALLLLSRIPDSPVAERARLSIAQAKVASRRRTVVFTPILVAIIAACFIAYLVLRIQYLGALGLALLIALPVLIWKLLRPGPAEIAVAMVDQMLCPSCVAELSPTDDSRIASCAVCHAKWSRSNLADVRSSAPPSRAEATA